MGGAGGVKVLSTGVQGFTDGLDSEIRKVGMVEGRRAEWTGEVQEALEPRFP